MKTPVISVILPVYNREQFIFEAIQSILDQTFQDFELLVIDDASTDGTPAILQRIKDPRVVVLSKKINEGVAAAINSGLRKARGRYIARMDSDDISAPYRFERQLQVFQEDPEVVVCGSEICILGSEDRLTFPEHHDLILVEMSHRCALSMGTSMFDWNRLSRILLNEDLRHGEDYEFWSRAIWKGKFYNVQEPLLYYRLHSGQLSEYYKPAQRKMDVEIRLSLLQKLDYSTDHFPNSFLKKMFFLDQNISQRDFKRFLQWLKVLKKENEQSGVFLSKEFNQGLRRMKNDLFSNLYFRSSNNNVDRMWRLKALSKMSFSDVRYIVNQKWKEYQRQ